MRHFSKPIISQLVLVLIGVGLVGAWSFLYARAAGLRQEYRSVSTLLAREQERVKTIQSLRDLVRDTQVERQALAQAFVREDAIIGFLDTVESTAAHAELLFEVINAQVTQEGLVLTIQTEGTFESTLYFTELLENLPYILSINSFETSTPNAKEKKWDSTIVLRLSSFIPKKSSEAK